MTTANEIELSELKPNVVPAQVDLPDIDDIVANVDGMLETYRNTPVSATTEKQAKQARADLNKTVKQISDVRKQIEKQIAGNWPEFKAKLMQIEKAGKEVADMIGVQLKELDEKVRQDKLQVIQGEIANIAQEYGLDPNKIIVDNKWLNKTAKWTETEQGIRQQFDMLKQQEEFKKLQIQQIEQYAKELEMNPDALGGYVSQLDFKPLEAVKSTMLHDKKLAEAKFEQQRAEAQAAFEAQQKREQEAQKVGDKLVDRDTGEIVEPAKPITSNWQYNLIGLTPEQKAFVDSQFNAWGVNYTVKQTF